MAIKCKKKRNKNTNKIYQFPSVPNDEEREEHFMAITSYR
jgi:hypothetical protein